MKSSDSFTYKNSGVDLNMAGKAIDLIRKPVFSTFTENVLGDLTSYAGLFALDLKKFRQPVLVSSTDGVGTKLLLAKETGIYENIGQDLFGMCLNDILCCGAEPLFFLDYIACGKLEPKKIEIIVNSIAESCKICSTALIGGEIAEMPDMYNSDDIDLAGFIVGIVEKSKIIKSCLVREGDIALGIASSGIHSNGFSLIRKIIKVKGLDLKKNYGFKEMEFSNKSLGKVLLTPTKLYFKLLNLYLSKKLKISGIAHITGGGFYENINRIIPADLDVEIEDGSWQVYEIFKFIQKLGNIKKDEMFRVFNMGIGMVLILNPELEEEAVKLATIAGERAYRIGRVVKGTGRVILV
ncbi:MAG: phosphoribosylformylglycinamidine cyclo-ligase [Actinobacteria bacterium]|nr:phosphoribosylformylglycinamidine cyclo-ligase [Actinomycetota bacterium]